MQVTARNVSHSKNKGRKTEEARLTANPFLN